MGFNIATNGSGIAEGWDYLHNSLFMASIAPKMFDVEIK
jgi:hypothetical protein